MFNQEPLVLISRVLVTGGTGYIGRHACVELIRAGFDVHILDNFSTSAPGALEQIGRVTGVVPTHDRVDLCNLPNLRSALEACDPDAVLHFAGLKSIAESVRFPERYYRNNVDGSSNLLEAMKRIDCRNVVFSSSCVVYGIPEELPITEQAPVGNTTNPYGKTKFQVEQQLMALAAADASWNVSILRYFNPVGAEPGGEMGEDSRSGADNLMPVLCRVAAGQQAELLINGDDYPTPDGTCIRDYIHVCDLAAAHVSALQRLAGNPGLMVHNLGTGRGYSVREMVKAFSESTDMDIPVRQAARRAGDVAEAWSDPTLAQRELDWQASRTLEQMCQDAWRYFEGQLPR